MSFFSKRTLIALTCATALGALSAAPSLAGVIAPTDKAAVSNESPIDSVHYRYGWCRHHHHHWRAVWGWRPYYYPYAYGYGYPYWGYPYGPVGVGVGVGGGLLGLGLGIL
jgi:hypothetical protein